MLLFMNLLRDASMHARPDGRMLWGVACMGALSSLALASASRLGTHWQLVAVIGAFVMGGLAMVWISITPRFDATPRVHVMVLALVVRVLAIGAHPLLEDDHYRYLWDGWQTVTGLTPYSLPPSAYFGAAELDPRWQAILSGINNPDIPTLYGPVLQYVFALGYLLTPGDVAGIQLMLLVVDMLTLLMIMKAGVAGRWALVYAIHPLILKEALASAHPDGIIGLLLVAAMLAWRVQRPFVMGLLIAAACATKVSAVLATPLLLLAPGLAHRRPGGIVWRPRDWLAWSVTGWGLAMAALYLPLMWQGGSEWHALRVFAEQWRFNPLAFRLLDASMPNTGVARAAGAVLVACAVGWIWRSFWQAQRTSRAPVWPPLASVMAVMLLLGPVVNPWYWLWGLAPAMLSRSLLVPGMGALAYLSYINTTVLHEAGWQPFSEQGYAVYVPITVIQMAAFAALLWLDQRRGPAKAQAAAPAPMQIPNPH